MSQTFISVHFPLLNLFLDAKNLPNWSANIPSHTPTIPRPKIYAHMYEITVLTTEDEIVQALTDGQTGTILVKETPFYATMGGQQGDIGVIVTENAEFVVEDTIKLQGGKVGHVGKVVKGMFQNGETVTLKVNEQNRALTARNHSATHLLHKALLLPNFSTNYLHPAFGF